MKLNYLSWWLSFLSLCILCGCSEKTPQPTNLEITTPYIRELPPGKQRTAAFMQITNHHTSTCTFTGGKARFAEKIELHQHTHKNGVMQMRRIDSVPIEPKQTLTLAPGGYHLMLFKVSQPLPAGMEVPIKLTFSDCPAVTTHAKVVGLFNK